MSNFGAALTADPQTQPSVAAFNQGRFGNQVPQRPALAGNAPAPQQQQQTVVTAVNGPKPLSGPTAANTYVIGVHEQQKFTHGALKAEDEAKALTSKPLLQAMQNAGLSTDESFNVKEVYLESYHNPTGTTWGTQLSGVNGRELKQKFHANGDWHTVTHAPTGEQAVVFASPDHPLGLLIAQNHLDDYGNVNVTSSPAQLKALAQVHPAHKDKDGHPTKYVVPLDLRNRGNPSVDPELKNDQLNQLGKVVFANAKGKLAMVPGLEAAIGGPLLYTNDDLEATKRAFPNTVVVHDPVAGEGHFTALIPADEFDRVVQNYGKQVVETAQPSKADAVTHRLVRVGRSASERHTDLSKEPNLSMSDLDRMKNVQTGVSSTWNYVIQHNGKPHVKKDN